MSTVTAVELSQAELTLLARMTRRAYVPGAPQEELDDAGWAAVGRGLIARGVINGRLRPTVEDDAAALLDVVLRFPAAAEYAEAVVQARRYTWVQSERGYGVDVRDRDQLTLIDAPDALRLVRPEHPGELPEDLSGTLVVQRVTVAEARERVIALGGGAG